MKRFEEERLRFEETMELLRHGLVSARRSSEDEDDPGFSR
jgi:hypothetical protein